MSSSASATARRLPARIGRFVPTRVLGRGGQGVVYLADDPDLGRNVALKCLHHRTRDPEKLLKEARNVARLDHPNIVALFGIELDHEPPYLVYQFAPGVPLQRWCRATEPLPVKRVADIMIKVLDAVHYAHEKQILHRDLTPANILIDSDDNPRILDFGISVALSESTAVSALSGTANYLAPELLAERPPSPASDLFALAVVMHELLTGRALFEADNPMTVIYKVLHERIAPPSLSRVGIDSALEAIVMKGLEKDPAQRYPSAAAMRDAMRDYLNPAASTDGAASPTADIDSAIAYLQRRMARKPDFPAISQHISEINQKSGLRDGSDASGLARIILKDYALTTKLLKVVNSAVYGQYGGSISTVSRAVIILGFEQVRAIALGIVIFEHVKNGEQADLLKDAACSSFLSGMLAKELCARERSTSNTEEVFIAAMFHRLGRHLAIYYFPDEYQEVMALIESKGCDETAAAREIFGVSLHDFGSAIARGWNLPERLVLAMRPQPSGKVPATVNPDARMAQLSAFSNEVAELLGGDRAGLDERLGVLVDRYQAGVGIDKAKLIAAVTTALEATRKYATIINVDLESAAFLGRVKTAVNTPESDDRETVETALTVSAAHDDNAEGKDAPTTMPRPASTRAGEPESDRDNRGQRFLTNAIGELTTAIVEKAPINDLFAMVLEAFYRSLDFTHVLFMMRDPRQATFRTRYGFGEGIEDLKARFAYVPGQEENIFRQAAVRGRNAVIIDTTDARYCDDIPGWCRELTAPQSILLFAVVVNKVSIGLIYADTCDARLSINAQELKLLNTLVKQLALGVNQR